jgi:hypothetical protein
VRFDKDADKNRRRKEGRRRRKDCEGKTEDIYIDI